MLVRVIAAVLIGWAVAELGLYLATCHYKHLTVAVWPCVVRGVPALLGLAGLIKSRSLAEWLSDTLDF